MISSKAKVTLDKSISFITSFKAFYFYFEIDVKKKKFQYDLLVLAWPLI